MSTSASSIAVQSTVKPRVFYQTFEKAVTFVIGTSVEDCDKQAVADFPIANNPHTYGLFREDGVTELLPLTAPIARVEGHEPPPTGSVGIHENEKLILRPSTVRGGA